MGLLRDYRLAKPKRSPGVRNWCPCCVPAEFCRRKGKHASQRVIKRAVRAFGKRLIREILIDQSNFFKGAEAMSEVKIEIPPGAGVTVVVHQTPKQSDQSPSRQGTDLVRNVAGEWVDPRKEPEYHGWKGK